MAFNRQDIIITTKLVDNVSGAARNVTKTIQDMGHGVEKTTTQTEGLNASGKKVNTTMTQTSIGVRKFRMELLSVMFFGMMLNRAFMGLIKTSMEWLGINELLSLSLGILFLPIAEFLLDYALAFLNWVTDLTEGEKKLLGATVLVAIVLSGLLTLFGQIGLGLSGLAMLFGSTSTAAVNSGAIIATQTKKMSSKLNKLARYGGATILFGLALKDGAEGQLTAALGDVMMGIGLLKGGKAGMWLGVIGFGLKLVGDEDFLSTVVAYTLKILDIFLRLGEEIGKIIVAAVTGKKYTMSADLKHSFATGVAQADMQSMVAKSIGLTIPGASGPGMVPTLENSQRILEESGLGDIFITQNNNISGVSSPNDVQEMIDLSNAKLTEDVRRSV